MNSHWVDKPDELAALAQGWARLPWLALDTEFVREDTYHAKPCLLQISDGVSVWIVDLVALGGLGAAWQTLSAEAVCKVLHSAGQDLELFVQLVNDCPRPLWDTQVAASLLGLGDQLGYAGLVNKRLGLTVDKSLARTDWTRRPLPEAALRYAADDVRLLAQIYPSLREDLDACGRSGWLAEDCAAMTQAAQYRPNPDQAWRRLKGLARLPGAAQQFAARLAKWREEEALRRNRPRRWILDDAPLYALAGRRPATRGQIESLGLLPPKVLERHAETLLGLLHGEPVTDTALVNEPQWSSEQKAALKRLQESVQDRAKELGVPATVLAPRADLEALVLHGPAAPIRLLRGWRRAAAGENLLRLLK